MTTPIDRDATTILKVLAEAPRDEYVDRNQVAQLSNLPPDRVNDAVALLVDSGYAEWIQTFGTVPYDFSSVSVTSRGGTRFRDRPALATDQAAARSEVAGEKPQVSVFDDPNSISSHRRRWVLRTALRTRIGKPFPSRNINRKYSTHCTLRSISARSSFEATSKQCS